MAFNFTKFEDRNSRSENRITVTASYSIGFPAKFYQDNNIDNYKYVVFYWDAEQQAIGLQFTNHEDKAAFRIVKTKGYGATVSAKSFFTKNSIDPKKVKGRYDWEKVHLPEVGEIFALTLKAKE